jgi:protein-tyrosine phosphatase
MSAALKTAILFICLGNICRSPLAEGVFRNVVENADQSHLYHIDSAATGSWHVGNPPDPRMIETASRHGTDLSNQRCRQITQSDFYDFDLIICMDHTNVQNVKAIMPADTTTKIEMFMPYALGQDIEVPDPYYMEAADGFEQVYKMVLEASNALLEKTL